MDLSNGAVFSDLLTDNSRSRHYSMMNISETVQESDIVTMNTNANLYMAYSTV